MLVDIGPFPDGDEERKIEIRVDGYDTWNLDHTLGMIIEAALRKFKEHPHGAPFIANEDVPQHLHRPDDTPDWESDPAWHDRWSHVLDEMLFAFEYGNKEEDYDLPQEERIANETRANEGRRLFAKYFHALWN